MMAMDSRQPHDDAKPLTEAQFLAEAPLLINLQKRAERATSLKEWAIARIQAAIYMARTSRIDEAAGVAKDTRSRFKGSEDAEVYVWLWILGGVLDYYQTGLTSGRSTLERALVVSNRLRRSDLFEYASAWTAHLDYIANDYQAMISSLTDARLDAAELTDAACRAALTIAVSWQICGDSDTAAKWFARARDLARSIGDRASIMASIENRALVWLDRVWFESCHKVPSSSILDQIEVELRSGLSYERVTYSESLIDQGPIARLRLLILRRDFDAALRLIGELNFDPAVSGFSIVRATPVLDLWLRAEMGRVERVDLATIRQIEASLIGVDDDDTAVCYGYLSKLAVRYGYSEAVVEFECASRAAFDRFQGQIRDLRMRLEEFPYFRSPRGREKPVEP